jgi:hypothetical protein
MISRAVTPRLMDKNAFATLSGKVTLYAIELLTPEWTATTLPRPNSI